MPSVAPANGVGRSGIREEPVFEQSWMKVPYEDFEGMTQQQYQDAVSPYLVHGKSVALDVPRGWRRVESSRPGRHLYVHMATGTISRFPKEMYDCKQECWVSKDGTPVPQEELSLNPDRRVLSKVGHQVAAASKAAIAAAAVVPAIEPPAPTKAEVAAEPAAAAAPAASGSDRQPVALLFPGQGSQVVGMLNAVQHLPAVKDMLAKADRILGYSLLDLCLQGPESKLEQTRYCQPAMYVGGLAALEKLRMEKREDVEKCQCMAGLSLGEYTALTAAGVFSFETGLRIVKLRAEAMQEAAEASAQSMLSVAGLSQETLGALCEEVSKTEGGVCQIANFLFPNGFACAGNTRQIEILQERAQKTQGCLQAKLLKTSGAFHTSLMQGARDKLVAALREVEKELKPPTCDVYMNVTGKKLAAGSSPDEIVNMLGEQLVSCVLWEPSMKLMIADGVQEFYECGPNKQLKAMLKRIDTKAWNATTNVDV